MLEISLTRGDFHIPMIEVGPNLFALKLRRSYFDLGDILEEWGRENMILTDEDYDKVLCNKFNEFTLNLSQFTELNHNDLLNQTKFKDTDMMSMQSM